MPDPQADRVIDKLMAERERVMGRVAQQESIQESAAITEVDTKLAAAGAQQPARMSEIKQILDEKGEVSTKDLLRIVARDSRRGM